jgi:hypothetical protein
MANCIESTGGKENDAALGMLCSGPESLLPVHHERKLQHSICAGSTAAAKQKGIMPWLLEGDNALVVVVQQHVAQLALSLSYHGKKQR